MNIKTKQKEIRKQKKTKKKKKKYKMFGSTETNIECKANI